MFTADQESNSAYYGGGYGGGMGGSWAMIILIVVVLWVLFSKDGRKDGYDGGYARPAYGYGDGCGPCVQPTFKDESNFEEERNINSKLCCIDKEIWETDRDVWKTACETQKVVITGDQAILDKLCSQETQALRDKVAEQNSMIQTMKGEAFTERKIDQVLAAIGCTNQRIEKLECEVPKRAPVYAECVTPNTHDIDCNDKRVYGNNYPQRGRCNYGCDDGYGYAA